MQENSVFRSRLQYEGMQVSDLYNVRVTAYKFRRFRFLFPLDFLFVSSSSQCSLTNRVRLIILNKTLTNASFLSMPFRPSLILHETTRLTLEIFL
jgi:hypothetical protein